MTVPRVRRTPIVLLAVLALAWASALAVVVPGPSYGAATKGSLAVIAVADSGTGLAGAVAGRPFDVVVEARDPLGVPLVLAQDTRIRLRLASGTGALGGVLDGVIPRRASRGTIAGATYGPFQNGVTVAVDTVSGTALSGTTRTFNVAASAVRAQASPRTPLSVTDPGCAAPSPTSPVCGFVRLPNGGNGTVLLSVGSCASILTCRTAGGTDARLVTADVVLKDDSGQPLYTRTSPAAFILACDKVLCGQGGVGHVPVSIDLTNTGAFTVVGACPSKGVVGPDQDVCLDTVQSTRDNAGDLYSVILFVHDIRGSYP